MNLSKKTIQTNDTKLSSPHKGPSLNPNAAEFIPFSLRSPSGSSSTVDATTRFSTSGTLGKAVLDRSESAVSNNSDDEVHQYWRHQLPDDITPDFKVTGEDESLGAGSLSLAGLSLHNGSELSRFAGSTGDGYIFNEQQDLSHHVNGNSFTDKYRYTSSTYGKDPTSAGFLHMSSKPWYNQIVSNEQLVGNGMEGALYNGISRHGVMNDMLGENAIADETDMNPLEFLASQFPGFAADSLAEVYFTNGCDLNLTIEMLTQLELQVDDAFGQNLNSKTLSAPNLSAMDFPALVPDGQNGHPKYAGDDRNPYRSSDKDDMLFFKPNSPASRGGATDFAAAVRKLASQDNSMWKYDRNGSSDANIGSSRSSHVLASSYNSAGHGRGSYGDRLQNRGSARGAPVWLETGDAVANMYSELREEARDHARLRNAYFEQARQAYLIGNKALAKELSVKGQLHNMQMKEAHGKAQESIYRQSHTMKTFTSTATTSSPPPATQPQLLHLLRQHSHNFFTSATSSSPPPQQLIIRLLRQHNTSIATTPSPPPATQHQIRQHNTRSGESVQQIRWLWLAAMQPDDRNPLGPEMQGSGRGQERMIDLHGLHVNEAIQVLKHELSVLRSTARAADQRLQVYICVGTGHHTRGSRTIARLPVAVQRYLLEEEGLDYSEPQPGLLRVVIY